MRFFRSFLLAGLMTLPSLLQAQLYNWVSRAGGPGMDEAYCVYYDANENAYITGLYNDSAAFGTTMLSSAGAADLFVARYDANGSPVWVQHAGSTGDQSGHVLTVGPSGDVYAAGEFEGAVAFGAVTLTSAGLSDVYVVKYNASGVLQWTFKIGGTGIEKVNSIECDATGNIFLTGHFESVCAFGPQSLTSIGQSDIYVAKLNTFGGVLWSVRAGGIFDDEGRGLAVLPGGDACVTGVIQDVASFGTLSLNAVAAGKEIFVARLSAAGTFQWAVKAGGPANDGAFELDADASGNLYVTGSFRGTAAFGSTNLTSAGDEDVFAAMLNPSGAFQWAARAGGTGADRGYAITYTPNAGYPQIYVTGSFEMTADFGPSQMTSVGDKDVFVGVLVPTGSWQLAWQGGGSGFDRGYGIEANDDGVVWITGVFEQSAAFGTNLLFSAGMNDLFLAKLGGVVGTGGPPAGPSVSLFPNPAGSQVTVAGLDRPATCRVYAMDGSPVLETTVTPLSPCVSLPEECSGTLLVRIQAGSQDFAKVVVVMKD